jgi:serpin B
MGLGIAFSYLADFSRISDTHLEISRAGQVAKIRVDEDGTEAAAGTYMGMMRCALMRADEKFIAERPFIFVLRDKKTSAILFAGKLSCP